MTALIFPSTGRSVTQTRTYYLVGGVMEADRLHHLWREMLHHRKSVDRQVIHWAMWEAFIIKVNHAELCSLQN